jgi:hypothetical protein
MENSLNENLKIQDEKSELLEILYVFVIVYISENRSKNRLRD